MLEIGARIKELRNSCNISQEELSARIDVSRGNVGDWERGRAKPGAEALIALSDYFNVSIDWLLTGVGCKESKCRNNFGSFLPEEFNSDDVILFAKLKQLSEKDRGKAEGYIDALVGSYPVPHSLGLKEVPMTDTEEKRAAKEGA